MRKFFSKIKALGNSISRLDQSIDEIKINQGIILSTINAKLTSKRLKDYEFKVFSQNGEDGIIQRLISITDIENKTFIEFGIGNFLESNCRFLLMKDNWSGFVIDSSSKNIKQIKNSYFYWRYQIDAVNSFITQDNINSLLLKSGFDRDVGILSIDIDGNDYHILESIETFEPRILICEYNAVFGKRKLSVPYDPKFNRTDKHYSNLYFGASLAAITHIANKKGYSLVGINSTSVNAFFIRNDLIKEEHEVLFVEKAYVPSKFRESRDEHDKLTCIGSNGRLALLKDMPVLNVETGKIERL